MIMYNKLNAIAYTDTRTPAHSDLTVKRRFLHSSSDAKLWCKRFSTSFAFFYHFFSLVEKKGRQKETPAAEKTS